MLGQTGLVTGNTEFEASRRVDLAAQQVQLFGGLVRWHGTEMLLVGVLGHSLYHQRIGVGVGEEKVHVLHKHKVAALCPFRGRSTRGQGAPSGLGWLHVGYVNREGSAGGSRGLQDVQELVLWILDIFDRQVEGCRHALKQVLVLHMIRASSGNKEVPILTGGGDGAAGVETIRGSLYTEGEAVSTGEGQ